MRILIVGLGSIGQRHARMIRSVLGDDAELWCLRKRGPELLIDPPRAEACHSVAAHYGMREFFDLRTALEHKPDAAFICNPTSMHAATAAACAQAGVNLFIEKPVGVSGEEFARLCRVVRKAGVAVCVGYQTRFDPLAVKVQELLSRSENARIVSCRMHWMTYLPAHHPYEDYREGYAARRDMGGGVVFSLSHELDLAASFFGLPESVYALQGSDHGLDMAVDTSVSGLFCCRCGKQGRPFPLQMQLSFAQGDEERGFSIETADAVIRGDFMRRTLECVTHAGQREAWDYSHMTRDDLFRLQCEQVLQEVFIAGGEPVVGIAEAGKSLSMAVSMHKSLESGDVENILPLGA